MRVVAFLAVAACTPEIVSGSYLCGPDASCPEGQTCDGEDNVCVLPGTARPFSCEPDLETEPDDTAATAHVLGELACVSLPFVVDNCMLDGDTADWVRFAAPPVCSSVAVNARVTFPIAFQRLALELWDLDRDELVANDSTCPMGSGESGDELRCMDATLAPGTSYGIQVRPMGEGDCDGACAHNRYTLRVQLATPR